MQLTLVILSVINIIVQLISWFGWLIIIFAIPAVLILSVFTIRNSQFVEKAITKILERKTGKEQSTSIAGNTTQSNYTTGTTDSHATTDEHNTYNKNYFQDGDADSSVEPIPGANSVERVRADMTTIDTPSQNTVDIRSNNDDTDVGETQSSFVSRDTGGDEQDLTGVKESDCEFTSDEVFSADRLAPNGDDFSSQSDAYQATGYLTSIHSEDVFNTSTQTERSIDSLTDYK